MTTTDTRLQDSGPVPSPGARRLALLALALGGFGIGTTEFVSMGLLPEIASSLGIGEPVAGHAISAYALGVVIGAPVIAVTTARVPRKALLVALTAVFVVGNAATAIAPTYETLVGARVLAGLPHGAYFGLAALVAAHIAPPGARARSVASVMLGLSVANVVGVPVASWLGQTFGWRAAFVLVTLIGIVTLVAVAARVPHLGSMPQSRPVAELGALRSPQVLLTLLVGAVGFGGLFAVYTYISTSLTDVAGMPRSWVPIALMVYGLGMVAGNIVGGRIADRALMPGLYAAMGSMAVMLAVFVVALQHPVSALIVLFLVGLSGAAAIPALQTRLMDVAGDAQTLAASLNHAALNAANAFGAWIGGVVIAAGLGYTAPAAVGALLAAAGVAVLGVASLYSRRDERQRHQVVVGGVR
ncbi:MFS transporter [Rhodococcus rhodnii]|uniref:MFS transporter n=1 Tax=Rhodococcus rhodnii TaxID=38312 RepID=UPI0003A21B7B|nr:MFS transporter [Rhodococcus rhodnii]